MTKKFTERQLVRHTGKYCRSFGFHSPPVNGMVIKVTKFGLMGEKQLLKVHWSDSSISGVLADYVELCPKNAQMSESLRDLLLQEGKLHLDCQDLVEEWLYGGGSKDLVDIRLMLMSRADIGWDDARESLDRLVESGFINFEDGLVSLGP